MRQWLILFDSHRTQQGVEYTHSLADNIHILAALVNKRTASKQNSIFQDSMFFWYVSFEWNTSSPRHDDNAWFKFILESVPLKCLFPLKGKHPFGRLVHRRRHRRKPWIRVLMWVFSPEKLTAFSTFFHPVCPEDLNCTNSSTVVGIEMGSNRQSSFCVTYVSSSVKHCSSLRLAACNQLSVTPTTSCCHDDLNCDIGTALSLKHVGLFQGMPLSGHALFLLDDNKPEQQAHHRASSFVRSTVQNVEPSWSWNLSSKNPFG